ncbi:MAG: PSD1 and planctomycete cytochrome C domain-containing protein, partial [Bacteroidota bacterium]
MNFFKNYTKWILPLVGLGVVSLGLAFLSSKSTDSSLPKTVDFNFHIRPILSQNCFTCHGPDSSSREAGLRLDTYEAATAVLENGSAAIVPGNSSKSLLLTRIHSQNPSEVMPPPEAKKELTPHEKALIERWIEQGVEWKPFWAFIPPQNPRLPRKLQEVNPSKIIDHFVDKQLGYRDLVPSAKANKSSLIRRVSYLLTGLPPSLEEVKYFLADTIVHAYETMVDHYLDSPHFGERWARHWMDLVRYGETMGHEFDYTIHNAWEYRDYLIRAFNQDVPYNLFVKEHLAGDLLEEPRRNPKSGFNESIFGTAYYFLGEGKHSPVNPKQEESDKIDNMIDVTSKTFMGLTVACARCHDHKFDPIPSTDYYSMYGMFESTRLSPLPARRTKEQIRQFNELVELKSEINKELQKALDIEGESKELLNQAVTPFCFSDPEEGENMEGASENSRPTVLADFRSGTWEGWYVDGWAFGKSPIFFEPLLAEEGPVLEGTAFGFASSRYYGKGIQGALRSPNFMIEHDSIAVRARGLNGTLRVIVDNFQLIRYPLWGGLEAKVTDSTWQTYTLDVHLAKGHKAYFEFLPGTFGTHTYDFSPEDYVEVAYAIAFDSTYTVPKRVIRSTDPTLEKVSYTKETGTNNTILSPREIKEINTYLSDSNWINAQDKLARMLDTYQSLLPSLYDSTHFIGMTEGEAIQSPIFIRGSVGNVSENGVDRSFFHALPSVTDSFSTRGSGRLAWAEAVVDTLNPIGTRVWVNRVWHHVFGKGIVETVDNFGLQGKLPTHPELLDYLTIHFQQEGWSTKRLIREILLSETFQRATESQEANRVQDPNNLYLHHFPLRRVEAEAIRDGILFTSGCMDRSLYGPSVPVYLDQFMTGRGRPRESGPLDGMGRRSIYVAIR